jgi:hypothetical protein
LFSSLVLLALCRPFHVAMSIFLVSRLPAHHLHSMEGVALPQPTAIFAAATPSAQFKAGTHSSPGAPVSWHHILHSIYIRQIWRRVEME